MLKLNKVTNQGSNPFPYVVIEDAFGCGSSLNVDFPTHDEFASSMRMDKDMSYPAQNYLHLITQKKLYNSLHNFVYSEHFVEHFLDFFRDDIEKRVASGELLFNPFELPIISSPYETSIFDMNANSDQAPFLFPRLDLGYGGVKYGKDNGGAGIHTDNAGRLISILYYVNTPDNMVGGEHRMYKIENRKPVVAKEVEPYEGRLLASLQTNYALHDVNPITRINGYRKAFYLAVSCNKPIWRTSEGWMMKLTSNRDPEKHAKSFTPLNAIKRILRRKLLR